MLGWVTCFRSYLAMLGQHWVSADAKNTKVERFIDIKHNGIAKKSLQKAFFGIFCENSNPRTPFFLYVKLLISLLNIAIFRLGEKFSAPGLPDKIFGGPPSAIIIAESRNPNRQSRFGENWIEESYSKQAIREFRFSSKLRTAVYPSNKAPIGAKLWENAFQTIPNTSFSDAQKNFRRFFFHKKFGLFFFSRKWRFGGAMVFWTWWADAPRQMTPEVLIISSIRLFAEG